MQWYVRSLILYWYITLRFVMFLFRIMQNNAEESTILWKNKRIHFQRNSIYLSREKRRKFIITYCWWTYKGCTWKIVWFNSSSEKKLKQVQEDREQVLEQKLLFQSWRQIQKFFFIENIDKWSSSLQLSEDIDSLLDHL